MKTHNKSVGEKGEVQAREMLAKMGYEILHCNYKTKAGEVDIVAKDGSTIVFVEVKTRTTDRFGRGALAVDEAKIRRITAVAHEYAYKHDLEDTPMRIDVVEIQRDSGVTHFKNITV